MGADPHTDVVSEIARLGVSIDRAATAIQATLAGQPPASTADAPNDSAAEHRELCRQLAALRDRVVAARSRGEGPQALRAELATLLSFSRTLQADADRWRSTVADQIEGLERQRAAAWREQQRQAADLEKLAQRRDALQQTILQTAARMAQQNQGECRRTIPVVTLGEGLTVCSVSVWFPRRWFRLAEHWLVTVNRRHDVLVRRE